MSKLIFGVGDNDVSFKVRINNKTIKEYSLWYDMMKRCYSSSFHQNKPTYKDCKVCEDWLKFSNFYNYCQENKQWLDLGYQLDKDLLIKNNKIYSPETCVFIPYELNMLLQSQHSKKSNLPVGVKLNGNGFLARFSWKGKYVHLGTYPTKEEAEKIYLKAKEEFIQNISKQYQGVISEITHEALKSYKMVR